MASAQPRAATKTPMPAILEGFRGRGFASLVCLYICCLTLQPAAQAQIVPDATLPNNSIVTPNGNTFSIKGGTPAGTNLFHSFEQFSVQTGQTAHFDNGLTIQNIISRVTGNSISNIDGLIKANGSANLYLVNPNGIIFGSNARLNIGGSFIGSTASSIRFSNGSEFSAVNPAAPTLLTINVPIGLQFGSNPGRIINQSTAVGEGNLPPLPQSIPIDNKVGLAVQPGQTLALVGGDIQLNGGNLTASSGQIILGSVKNPGVVGLIATPFGLSLNYDNIQNFGNIQISDGALINTSGIGGGKVEIRGGLVTLSDGRIYGLTLGNIDGRNIDINAQQLQVQDGSQIATLALTDGKGGNINIDARDSVEISGIGFDRYQQFLGQYLIFGTFNPFDRNIVLGTATYGNGNAGNIEIETGSLRLRDGAIAGSTTFGAGNVGNLTINANVVEMVGATINTGTLRGSTGTSGNIAIATQRLMLRDGATLGSVSNSNGASGNINIQAVESVELLRTFPGTAVQTLIGTSALDPEGIGRAGNITIDTKRLIISEGAGITSASGGIIGLNLLPAGGPGGNLTIRATESVEVAGISGVLANGGQSSSFIAADTSGSSRGGNIDISTPALILRDGGSISAGSLNAAEAGSITINADRIEMIGIEGNGLLNSKIAASVGRLYTFTNPNATGTAGSVNLNVNQLIIRDRATINVQALGTGRAGSINVVGNSITLDNQASIDGATGSGSGANINLQVRNVQLRGGSRIRTDAGASNGGNITINTGTLVALENSDITANAQQGAGGRVIINTQGIFGTQFRDRTTPFSDITATSELGAQFNGIVQINSPEVQPAAGLIELPETLTDPTNQIVQTCSPQTRANSFTITGKGGLPPNPREYLNISPAWIDWRIAPLQVTSSNYQIPIPNYPSQNTLVEATGWVVDGNGTVRLVAQTPSQELFSNQLQPNCNPTYK